MPERILLIEDDRELGAQIIVHLKRAGFETEWWREGRRILPGDAPDVAMVVLDLMVPGPFWPEELVERVRARLLAEGHGASPQGRDLLPRLNRPQL
jgi:DNA-binding NtrC family response regulator